MSRDETRVSGSAEASRRSASPGAVFLSYASEDAAAAERIAATLRNAGIEVWFDKSELRGGEAWDREIRRQIRECTLFIAIVSASAHARVEGYFRLEWNLALERMNRQAPGHAFLLPVVVDDTRRSDDRIPDRFRELQWASLPGGVTPPDFVDRVRQLLSPERVTEPDSTRFVSNAAATRATPPGGLIGRTGLVSAVIAAVATLALGYFAVERLTRFGSRVPGAASIAVLPLANESGEASQQYFSDGISEDLITALSQFPGLKVIGRTSAFQFRDSREDSRSIGAKLAVAHLLEGSVRRSGEIVRVSVELIDTADGSTQWSERYDRAYKDLFALQDEITRAVAGALRRKLLPGEHAAAQSERPPGGSLEAYNALLQGRFYHFRETEADFRKAIEFYAQAAQLDPRYALAWSGLAHAWSDLTVYYLEGAAAREAYARAREAADRALALSPELAAAHLARGDVLQSADFEWRGAEAEYRRALALAPNDGETQFFLGRQLASFGDLESAISLTRQALTTEPLRSNWYNWLALYLSGRNRLDEAEGAIRKAIELQPTAKSTYYTKTLAIIEVRRGDAQAALAAARQAQPGVWQDTALAFARQIGGDRSAADGALRTMIEKYAGIGAYQIAQLFALRNDPAATFEWLDRAWLNRDAGIGYLLYDPFIQRYKNDPRFSAYCRKVGLPVPGEGAARKA